MVNWKRLLLPLIIISFMLTACPPKQVLEIDDAKAAIADAKANGAEKWAPTTIKAADEALVAAEAARQKKDYPTAVAQAKIAKQLAEQAKAESKMKDVAEIAEAQRAIDDAVAAGADKYAPAKLQAARNALNAAKAAQQNRNYEEAAAQANEAKRLAMEAKEEALNAQAIQDVPEIGKAQQAIDTAVAAGAEKYAPEKLQCARDALAAAKAAQRNRNYAEAVRQANISIQCANEAKAMADAAREGAGRFDASVFAAIYFDFDKYDIKGDYRGNLDNASKSLNGDKELRVVITGYCDPRGTDEYNMALGERRANAVRDYLVNGGAAGGQIRTVSKGESEQADSNCKEEGCWGKERRAVFSEDK